jgi:O-antigen/teichoic acid export membrane protein
MPSNRSESLNGQDADRLVTGENFGVEAGKPTPKSGLKRDSLWMLTGQSLAVVFQGAYFVLIGRALGSHEYGKFVGVAALVSVLAQFSSLGMDLIIIRDVSRDEKSFPTSWGLALELSAAGFLVITAIAIALGHFILSPEVRILIPFIALSDVLFGRIAMLTSKAFQGFSQFASSAKLMVMNNFARTLVAGVLYLHVLKTHVQSNAYTWTKIYWLSSLTVAVAGLVVVTMRFGLPKWRKVTWKEISEGFSFSLSSSSVSIYNDIDKTYLVSIGQSGAAGIYSAAYRIIDVASAPIYSIYSAAFPQFFREGAKSVRHANKLSHKLLEKTVLYSVVAAVLMFFGAPFLPFVLGKSFAASTSALRWLCLLPLIRCFHYAAGSTITGSVSQWYRTVQQIAAALLNLGLNALLIPRFSWQGAAVASLLTDGTLAAMNWLCVAWLIARHTRSHAETSG